QTLLHETNQPVRRHTAVLTHPPQRTPIHRMHRRIRHQRPRLQFSTLRINKEIEIRKPVRIPIGNSLEAIKRNPPRRRHPSHRRRLHIHQHRLMLLRQRPLLIRPRHMVQRNQPISIPARRRKPLARPILNHFRNHANRARLHRASQRPRPSIRNQRIWIRLRKHSLNSAFRRPRTHSARNGHGFAIPNAPGPQIRPTLLPSAHQRLQFSRHRGDNRNLLHTCGAYACGAYPFARNHSIADRSASSTGSTRNPSSRSAFADEANIFFFPIRTSSTVARGSRPRSSPVTASSKYANAIATPCGTFIVGDFSPVIAAIRSRICFSVKFSPPRMYRSPTRP